MLILDDILGSMIANGLGGLFRTAASRLVGNVAKTPGETAMIERYEQAQKQFLEKQSEDRQALLAQFEHRDASQKREIEARFSLAELHADYQRWPFDNLPHQIIGERSAYGNRAINLFIYTASGEFFHPDGHLGHTQEETEAVTRLLRGYIGDVSRLNTWLLQHYPKNDPAQIVLPYIAVEPPKLTTSRTPHTVSTTLRRFFSTEPSVFVHFDFQSLEKVQLYLEVWGVVDEGGIAHHAPPSLAQPLEFDLTNVTEPAQRALFRSFSIKAVLAGLIDLAHLMGAGGSGITPRSPHVLLHDDSETLAQNPKLLMAYAPFIEEMQSHAPDIAATAALEFASSCLKTNAIGPAREYFRMSRDACLELCGVNTSADELAWYDVPQSLLNPPRHGVRAIRSLLEARAGFADIIPPEARIEPSTLFSNTDADHQDRLQRMSLQYSSKYQDT